jgi:hypothetical protein
MRLVMTTTQPQRQNRIHGATEKIPTNNYQKMVGVQTPIQYKSG